MRRKNCLSSQPFSSHITSMFSTSCQNDRSVGPLSFASPLKGFGNLGSCFTYPSLYSFGSHTLSRRSCRPGRDRPPVRLVKAPAPSVSLGSTQSLYVPSLPLDTGKLLTILLANTTPSPIPAHRMRLLPLLPPVGPWPAPLLGGAMTLPSPVGPPRWCEPPMDQPGPIPVIMGCGCPSVGIMGGC